MSVGRRKFARDFAATSLVMAMPAIVRAQPAYEPTLDRIRRTGTLRISVLPGEQPFFRKDLVTGEWSGAAMDMARSIASTLNARLTYVEATYATSVLDLQANKSDLAFALNPTPPRPSRAPWASRKNPTAAFATTSTAGPTISTARG